MSFIRAIFNIPLCAGTVEMLTRIFRKENIFRTVHVQIEVTQPLKRQLVHLGKHVLPLEPI